MKNIGMFSLFKMKHSFFSHFSKAPRRFYSEAPVGLDKNIPSLEIVSEMSDRLPVRQLSNTAIIGVQHMLPSTASMFDIFIDKLKIDPKKMFFAGKFYSTHSPSKDYIERKGIYVAPTKTPKKPGQYNELAKESVVQLWEELEVRLSQSNNIDTIIVLDEGGYCLEAMPKSILYRYKLAGIEQTRYGLYSPAVRSQLFPLIDVATCAAKRSLESDLIAESILRRIAKILPDLHANTNPVFGVVGNGAIGSAVTKYLLDKGFTVAIYDENEGAFQDINDRKCFRLNSIESLVVGTDIIFGCTGRDITKDIDIINLVKSRATFISCSSQEIEFLSLSKQIAKQGFSQTISNNISRLVYMGENGQEISILESGFPINFDRTPDCDVAHDMELTRGLLFGAVVQASLMAKKLVSDGRTLNKGQQYMLDPYLQNFLVNNWKKNQPQGRYSKSLLDCFNDIEWIKKNSGGVYSPRDEIMSAFKEESASTLSHSSNLTRGPNRP